MGRHPVPVEERFHDKHVADSVTGCWLWTASRTGKGYGFLKSRGRQLVAHRVSYEMHKGPIPAGMDVCHSCDVPSCVNPAHLWLGTPLDNARDMAAKGRQRYQGKTHCVRGHPYDGIVTRASGRTHRVCLTCKRERARMAMRRSRARRREDI